MKPLTVLFLAVIFLVVCGATPTRPIQSTATAPPAGMDQPRLSYQTGPCNETSVTELKDELTFSSAPGMIRFDQQARYVCCAKIDMALQKQGSLLKVTEINTGKVCKCICGYHLQGQIEELPPGSYQVQVWGIQFQESIESKLLGESTVTLTESDIP
jgi:hypothetical protein